MRAQHDPCTYKPRLAGGCCQERAYSHLELIPVTHAPLDAVQFTSHGLEECHIIFRAGERRQVGNGTKPQ